MTLPPYPDDFCNRRVEVELGDEAVCDAKENLRILLGLLLQLTHCVHISDGVHCRNKRNHISTSAALLLVDRRQVVLVIVPSGSFDLLIVKSKSRAT